MSDDNPLLTIPASVIVNPGAITATFAATAGAFLVTQTAVITAALNGVSVTTNMVLVAPTLVTTLVCYPTTVSSGGSTTCTVSLNQSAGAGGNTISLTSSNSALTVPASVTVPATALSASFAATAGTVTSTQTATITASLNGVSQTASLSLVAPILVSTLVCNPTSINTGSISTCTVTLSAAASSDGASVSLSSNSPVLSVPGSLTVPASSNAGAFTVTAQSTSPRGESSVVLTAALNGSSQAETFDVTVCPCSVWPSTAQPVNPASTNKKAIEVGMKFTSAVSGYITGIRFYKGLTNIGTHVGNLWSSTGTLLATVTFNNESPSGWQVADFSSPVAVMPTTAYIASYHAPQGHNAADNGFFTNAGENNAPLHALADGQNGPDGVYVYGSSAYPSTGASATNYWVDVVFNTSPAIGAAAPVSLWTPTNVPHSPAASTSDSANLGMTFVASEPGFITGLRFYKSPKNTGKHLGYLWTSSGTALGSVVFINESASGWQQANFPSPIPINAGAPYVISYWAPHGHYADDAGYFATTGFTNQMLYAPPDGQYGSNGSYYPSFAFPATAGGGANYWVDVVFTLAIQ